MQMRVSQLGKLDAFSLCWTHFLEDRVALLSVLAKLNSSTKVHRIILIWIRAQLEPNWSPLEVDCKQTGNGVEVDWKWTGSGLEVNHLLF